MKQRKIFNKQTAVYPLVRESGRIDVEKGKQAYVSPQLSVVCVALEGGIAAASLRSGSVPQVNDWETGTSEDGDIAIN